VRRAEPAAAETSAESTVALAAYDGFYTSLLRELSVPSYVGGVSMAVGVVAEIAVFAWGRPLLTRFRPTTLVAWSVGLAVPRWALTAWATTPLGFALPQVLHGANFGLLWVAGIAWCAERAPPGSEASAQAILPTALFGIGRLLGLVLAALLLRYISLQQLFGAAVVFSLCSTGLALNLRSRDVT